MTFAPPITVRTDRFAKGIRAAKAAQRKLEVKLRLKAIMPSNAELLAWAKKHPAPQSWRDETDNPFEAEP